MRGMDRLLELQDLDTRIARLEQRRRELESGEDLAAAHRAREEAESVLGELRLALDEVDRSSRRLEQEIESYSAKAAAEEKRMYDGSIVNQKEVEALQHEIASLKERRSRAEDALLEQMERREELDTRATAAAEQVETARAHADEVGGDASRELDDIGRTLTELASQRMTIEPAIGEELLELYEDLRRQKHGVGAAALVDGVCQACHEALSAVELDKLKHEDGIRRCEYCRRILVMP
jgi:uncharacterized protein